MYWLTHEPLVKADNRETCLSTERARHVLRNFEFDDSTGVAEVQAEIVRAIQQLARGLTLDALFKRRFRVTPTRIDQRADRVV
jgi:hypothetical protein